MKYVAVKHKPEHRNVWWFSVPEELEDKVYVGAEVLCATSKGNASGKVESILDGVPQSTAEAIIGDHFPLKTIYAVKVDMNIEDIHVPIAFLDSNPDAEKIKERIKEWYSTAKFNTPILFSPDGNLKDGYTAYLVAKMFEHDTLKGYCIIF